MQQVAPRQCLQCRAEWNEWGKREDEDGEKYEQRIRDTFLFKADTLPPELVSEVYQDGSQRQSRGE